VRCPRCRAGNPDLADWCGQCLMRFGAPIPAPAPPPVPAGQPEVAAGVRGGGDGAPPTPGRPPDLARTVAVQLVPPGSAGIRKVGERLEWTCRACDAVNPVDDMLCRRCGSSMLDLFRPAAPRAPRDGRVALALSLVCGLGHWYAGAPGQAVSRLLLWLWWLGTAAAFRSRPEAALTLVEVSFAAAALGLWVASALDAWRLARRERPLLRPRALAAVAAALILILVVGVLATVVQVRGRAGPPAAPAAPAPWSGQGRRP
jgi:ribosomal protein L40E